MTKWPLIACFVIVSGLGLGACSSSSLNGLTGQANLMGENDEMCSSQAAYAKCMQQRYAAGSAGYNEEEGQFAPGSQARSLADIGR